MVRCYLTLRADVGKVAYPSKASAMAAARASFGGRVYRSHVYTIVDSDDRDWSAVSLYPSLSECRADHDGAHAARLEYYHGR